MDEYRIEIVDQAQAQMAGILDYITFKLQNPGAAVNLRKRFAEEIASLNQMPRRMQVTDEEPWRSQGIHRMLVGSYYVYFSVADETMTVFILAVILARKDQKKALQGSIPE